MMPPLPDREQGGFVWLVESIVMNAAQFAGVPLGMTDGGGYPVRSTLHNGP